ncbi:MAG TPA: STAS domain-containing protein [Terracidiphilus sp.]
MHRALLLAWRRTGQPVLRISFEENAEAAVIKLEGRVAGPWATELGRLWEEKAQAIAKKKLVLDLRGTTYADASGIKVLRAIYSQTEASILTDTPWTEYLADEVTRKVSQIADTEN